MSILPTIEEVTEAYFECRKHKQNTRSAIEFETGLARNLCRLHDELVNQTYAIGQTKCFVVTHPGPREIWAGAFRDRIVHHVLYNRIGPAFNASFSAASCACIPGRGTLYGAKRLERQIRRVTQNWSRRAFYLKLDLSNFFVSIHKPTLFNLLEVKIKDDWTRWLTETILFHDPTENADVRSGKDLLQLVPPHKSLFNSGDDRGLPIGNLSSQFFANVYLNSLDKFVDHRIKPLGYIRYVDDFVLLHESPSWLINAKSEIEQFLDEKLKAKINPKKTVLQPIDRGVDFVGQVVKPWRRLARGKLLPAALKAIRQAQDADSRLHISNSYLGLFRQASATQERLRIARRMQRHGHAIDANITKAFPVSRHATPIFGNRHLQAWLAASSIKSSSEKERYAAHQIHSR